MGWDHEVYFFDVDEGYILGYGGQWFLRALYVFIKLRIFYDCVKWEWR